MRVRVGTSGFSYGEWKGSFYPEDLPNAKMLGFYASRLGTVEINNTFYRFPRPPVLEGWTKIVPPGFSFALKAQQRISHVGREGDLAPVGEAFANFFAIARSLGDRLGPILVSLAPYLERDVARLRAFLDVVPPGARVALELPREDWLDEEVYVALRERDVALVIVEDAKRSLAPRAPLVATARFGYLRLRRDAYAKKALDAWAERIAAAPWEEAWVFFKHEIAAPRHAATLERALASRGVTVIHAER